MRCPIGKCGFAKQKRFGLIGESGGLFHLSGSLKPLFTAEEKAWLVFISILNLCKFLMDLLKTVLQQLFDFSSQYRQIFPFITLICRV